MTATGGFGAALLAHDDRYGGRALEIARLVQQRAQVARDALGAIFARQQLPRDAELPHANALSG